MGCSISDLFPSYGTYGIAIGDQAIKQYVLQVHHMMFDKKCSKGCKAKSVPYNKTISKAVVVVPEGSYF